MPAPQTTRDARTAEEDVPDLALRHESRVGIALGLTALALLVLAPVAVPWLAAVRPGLGPGLAVAGVGLTLVAVCALGELTGPGRRTPPPSRSPFRGTIRDVAPRPATVWLVVVSGVLIMACVPRALLASTPEAAGRWSSLAAACLTVLAATHGVLGQVLRRPVAPGTNEATDLALRRRSAGRVLRATQLVLGLAVGAVLVVDAHAIASGAETSGPAETAAVVLRVLAGLVVVGSISVAAAGASPVPGARPGTVARRTAPGPGAQA